MLRFIPFLACVFFFWGQYEICQKLNAGNPVVLAIANLAARVVTGAIDAATANTSFATNWSEQPEPWIGISAISVLLLLLGKIYYTGFVDREHLRRTAYEMR